jgi:hypothetical protein
MHLTNQRNATDIQDKVYGVLALVTNWWGEPPLIPSYNLPPGEVFTQATVSHIQGTLSLQTLMGTTRSDVADIPSWVTETGRYRTFTIQGYSRMSRASLFSATGDTAADVKRMGNILKLDGIKAVDTIAHTGPIMVEADDSRSGIVAVVKAWRHMTGIETENKSFHTNQRAEHFWRTLISNSKGWLPSEEAKPAQLDSDRRVPIQFRKLGDDDITPLAEELWSWLQCGPPGSEKRTFAPGTDIDQIGLFWQSFQGATFFRKFFTTTGGRMGVGPPETRPGDEIALLYGGEVPFCLRAERDQPEGHYKLVGDLYVHGLMEGEGLPPDWEKRVEKIYLC